MPSDTDSSSRQTVKFYNVEVRMSVDYQFVVKANSQEEAEEFAAAAERPDEDYYIDSSLEEIYVDVDNSLREGDENFDATPKPTLLKKPKRRKKPKKRRSS